MGPSTGLTVERLYILREWPFWWACHALHILREWLLPRNRMILWNAIFIVSVLISRPQLLKSMYRKIIPMVDATAGGGPARLPINGRQGASRDPMPAVCQQRTASRCILPHIPNACGCTHNPSSLGQRCDPEACRGPVKMSSRAKLK